MNGAVMKYEIDLSAPGVPVGHYVPLTPADLALRDVDAAAAVRQQTTDLAAAWHVLRMQRDRWLAETDWLINPQPADAPKQLATDIAANHDAWLQFRQALRDLPANTPDPARPVWPPQPPAPAMRLT